MRCSSRDRLSARSPRQTPRASSRRPPLLSLRQIEPRRSSRSAPSAQTRRPPHFVLRTRRARTSPGSLSVRIRTALLLLVALALPASADAHAFLVSSTPASGVSLARAPRVVTLRFTEPVSLALTHVQIFDGRGTPRERSSSQRGPRGERAPRRAPAARDRCLSHHLFDGLGGRSPRHSRGHRVRRRDRRPAGQGLGCADGWNESHRERRAPLRSDLALASDRRLRAARGRPARGGARSRITSLRTRRAAGAAAGGCRLPSPASRRRSRCGCALRHPMGSRDTRAGARDRDRADRARDTPAEARARACSCPSQPPRPRVDTPRRSARSRSSR